MDILLKFIFVNEVEIFLNAGINLIEEIAKKETKGMAVFKLLLTNEA